MKRNASAIVAPASKNRHFLGEKKNEEKYFAGSRQKRIWKATSALSHNRHNTKVYSIAFRKPSYVCQPVARRRFAPVSGMFFLSPTFFVADDITHIS